MGTIFRPRPCFLFPGVSAEREGGELTGLEGKLDGVPSPEASGPFVRSICEDKVTITVCTLSSGGDS